MTKKKEIIKDSMKIPPITIWAKNEVKPRDLKCEGLNKEDLVSIPGYYIIGKRAPSNSFFKYMGLEAAIMCLRSGSIRFSEPNKWIDRYESRFYKAEICGEVCSPNNPVVFASCLTYKRNNEAAWKIYSYNATGLAARCVQFKINRNKFRVELLKAIQELKIGGWDYELFEGVVQYIYEKDFRRLHHKPTNKKGKTNCVDPHTLFFGKFDFVNYLNLLLLKSDAFQHEQEVRFFIVPKDTTQLQKGECGFLDLNINWSNVIEEVLIDRNCTDLEENIIAEALINCGNNGGKVTEKTIIDKIAPKRYDVYGSAVNQRKLIIK